MEALWNTTTRITRVCAWIGGAMLIIAAVLVSVEVISRKLLSVVFSGSDEMAAYLFATGTALSLGHVLVTRGHVRIDALYAHLPLSVRAILDVIALLLLGLFATAMLDRALDLVTTNWTEWNRANTPLRTPLALPQFPWLFGLGLFWLSIAIALIRTARALFTGDLATARQTAGVASQDEEIEGELASLGIAIGQATPGANPGPAARK